MHTPEPCAGSGAIPRVESPAFRHDALEGEPVSAPVPPLASVRAQRISLVIVVLVAFGAAAWVASALWAGLLLGVLVAFAIEPAHRRLQRALPGRRGIAAGITVSVVALALTGAAAGLVVLVGREIMGGAAALEELLASADPASLVGPRAREALARVGVTPALLADQAMDLSAQATSIASRAVSAVVGSAFSWFAGALTALVTLFYTLKDRRPIERRLEEMLPLHPRTTRELVEEFRRVGRGTLIGSAVAGAIQGTLAAVGYSLGGLPRPVLLGALTAAASLVPVLGTLLVWVPAGVFLILSGHAGAGAFQLAWGALVTTSLVDYVLRPVLVGRESRSHPLLFLIGLIGGVEVLGAAGIVAGPIVMTLFASVLRIYRREVVEPVRRVEA